MLQTILPYCNLKLAECFSFHIHLFSEWGAFTRPLPSAEWHAKNGNRNDIVRLGLERRLVLHSQERLQAFSFLVCFCISVFAFLFFFFKLGYNFYIRNCIHIMMCNAVNWVLTCSYTQETVQQTKYIVNISIPLPKVFHSPLWSFRPFTSGLRHSAF